MKPTKRFYVYTLAEPDIDEDGSSQVFYVGKGCGKRVNEHEKDARQGSKTARCERIRALWAAGKQVEKRIVFETDNEREAYRYEVRLIAQIGRENLTNGDGGGPLYDQRYLPFPGKRITDMTDTQYLYFLRHQPLTEAEIGQILERWRRHMLARLETRLRAAYHNRRLNGWDTTEEIARLESEIEVLHIILGDVWQETMFLSKTTVFV